MGEGNGWNKTNSNVVKKKRDLEMCMGVGTGWKSLCAVHEKEIRKEYMQGRGPL
jgi:hypothetical protein